MTVQEIFTNRYGAPAIGGMGREAAAWLVVDCRPEVVLVPVCSLPLP
jgi:hypothetical protein